jgi:hypothetical protein
VSKIKRHLEESMSWQDIANLTHATQVESLIGALVRNKSNSLMRIALEWERERDEINTGNLW